MHEYLAPLKLKYSECRLCRKRSAHICFRCGYCYSCHARVEEIERKKIPANAGLNRTDIESLSLSG